MWIYIVKIGHMIGKIITLLRIKENIGIFIIKDTWTIKIVMYAVGLGRIEILYPGTRVTITRGYPGTRYHSILDMLTVRK